MPDLSQSAIDELGELDRDGKLAPVHVLEVARNPGSALHAHFNWDDALAAQAYRIEQADRLICKVRVRILPREDDKPRTIRALVQSASNEYGREANCPWLKPAARSAFSSAAAPAVVPDAPAPAPKPAPAPQPDEGEEEDDGDGDDDDDDDEDERDDDDEDTTQPDVPAVRHRASSMTIKIDAPGAQQLLHQALAELAVVRRRYAHLVELRPVFEQFDRLVKPEAVDRAADSRLLATVELAREYERAGMDRFTAAERAARAHAVDRGEVLAALRATG